MLRVNKYDYGNTGYVVKQVGTKIIVTGGSDAAITNAIKHLKETVFGIKKNNDPFVDFTMAADKAYEVKQSNYSLKEIKIDGSSIRDYVITHDGSEEALNNAKNLQTNLYTKCGIRLEIMAEKLAKNNAKISFRLIENDGEGGGYYVNVDEGKNLNIECEYKGWFVDLTTKFFNENVFNKKNTLSIDKEYSYAPNYRDIYYKDYAVGDGKTDDFFALKTVHDLANENLLNVHADKNQTYYIGKANGDATITVKTNTYWHGCEFIFDDKGIEYNSVTRQVPIFTFSSDSRSSTFWGSDSPIQTLEAGATNVGWKPGKKVMLVIYQSDIRHYIRYGQNASQSSDPSTWGMEQHELIIVDENGNVVINGTTRRQSGGGSNGSGNGTGKAVTGKTNNYSNNMSSSQVNAMVQKAGKKNGTVLIWDNIVEDDSDLTQYNYKYYTAYYRVTSEDQDIHAIQKNTVYVFLEATNKDPEQEEKGMLVLHAENVFKDGDQLNAEYIEGEMDRYTDASSFVSNYMAGKSGFQKVS